MANESIESAPVKAKRKFNETQSTKILADCTLKDFPFYYLRISLVAAHHQSSSDHFDELTVKKYFNVAMAQRYGTIGSAVSLDIIKLDGDHAWIRVPFEDRALVTEALSGWSGNGIAWRIRESGCWLGGLTGSDGRDLFDD